jgi:hypothetical protein
MPEGWIDGYETFLLTRNLYHDRFQAVTSHQVSSRDGLIVLKSAVRYRVIFPTPQSMSRGPDHVA